MPPSLKIPPTTAAPAAIPPAPSTETSGAASPDVGWPSKSTDGAPGTSTPPVGVKQSKEQATRLRGQGSRPRPGLDFANVHWPDRHVHSFHYIKAERSITRIQGDKAFFAFTSIYHGNMGKASLDSDSMSTLEDASVVSLPTPRKEPNRSLPTAGTPAPFGLPSTAGRNDKTRH